VPFFIFDHKYSVAGAQNPEVFVDLIDRILAGEDENKVESEAEIEAEAP
jgi:predicted DsbA family dithiol-disulfide isomerase